MMAGMFIACNLITPMCYAAEIEEVDVVIDEESSDEVEEETSSEEATETVDETQEELPTAEDETVADAEEAEESSEDEDKEEEETPIEEDKDSTAKEEDEKFVVSFIDSIDDTEFASYTVSKNESVEELPEAPEHEGYEFREYEGNYTDVVSDETVTAVYELVEDEKELTYLELSCELEGYSISVIGNMPKDTKLQASIISNEEAEEQVSTEVDSTFKAEVTFDISLVSDGSDYQPTDFGEEVAVSIKGIESTENLEVFRITDDGTVTDMQASDLGDEVRFDTDHFTIYTLGLTEYESTKTETWHGLNCDFYDTDSDGIDDLVVVTGTQTSPYIIICESDEEYEELKAKYEKDNVYEASYINGELEFGVVNENNLPPWKSSNIKTCHVEDATLISGTRMFYNCTNLEEIVLDVVDTSACLDMNYMFFNCSSMSKFVVTTPLNASSCRGMEYMFSHCTSLTTLDVGNNFASDGLFEDTSKVRTFENMFWGSNTLTSIDLSTIDGTSAETMANMFNVARDWQLVSDLKTIKLPSNLKLAANVQRMFSNNESLEGSLDTTNWDTSRVTNMERMFYKCCKLQNLDVTNWDVSNVTTLHETFCVCQDLKALNVTNWDVSNVTDMDSTFVACYGLTELDVSNWNTGNVTIMKELFMACKNLTALDVSNWDVSKVEDMQIMFRGCENIEYLNLSNWDVSSVTKFGGTYTDSMFDMCGSLRVIDFFRTDNIKDGVKLCKIPTWFKDGEYIRGEKMYLDDDKDGVVTYKDICKAFIPNISESYRYVMANNIEIPENTLAYINDNYTIVNIIEPSDDDKASGPNEYDPGYGKYKSTGYYLVKDFYIAGDKLVDETDSLNKKGRSRLYTLTMDGKTVYAFAGVPSRSRGDDGEYDTEDDYMYWAYGPLNFFLWRPSYSNSSISLDETYEMYKEFIKYSTGEKVILDKDEWTLNKRLEKDIMFEAYKFRLANFKLTLKDEHGTVLYSDYLQYKTDISDILSQYGTNWLDSEGKENTVTSMPLEAMTLSLAHVHVEASPVKENQVAATCTYKGHYDEVVYCSDCGAELSREEIDIPALGHEPGEPVVVSDIKPTHTEKGLYVDEERCKRCNTVLKSRETTLLPTDHEASTPVTENRVEPTCTKPGHYDVVVYCKDDNAEIERTTVEIPAIGHTEKSPVKENIVDATTEAEGSYDEVVYCEKCHAELSRTAKTIDKVVAPEPTDTPSETPSDTPSADDTPSTEPAGSDEPAKQDDTDTPSVPTNTDEGKDNPSNDNPTPENPSSNTEPSNSEEVAEEEPVVELLEEIEKPEVVVDNSTDNHSNEYNSKSDEAIEYKDVDIAYMSDDESTEETTAVGTDTKDDNNTSFDVPKILKAVVVTLTTTGATGGCLFFFFWWRRRKVKGKLMSKDGVKYSHCLVTLEGRDKLHTYTDANGVFSFKNLKKDTYVLNVFNENEDLIFSCEIFTAKTDDNFHVLKNNTVAYQYGRSNKSYYVDILA